MAGPADLTCETPGCLVQHAIVSPLVIEDRVAGALVALTDRPTASLLRATEDVAVWTAPLSFATMVTVFRLARRRVPGHAGRIMMRLHTPRAVQLDRS